MERFSLLIVVLTLLIGGTAFAGNIDEEFCPHGHAITKHSQWGGKTEQDLSLILDTMRHDSATMAAGVIKKMIAAKRAITIPANQEIILGGLGCGGLCIQARMKGEIDMWYIMYMTGDGKCYECIK